MSMLAVEERAGGSDSPHDALGSVRKVTDSTGSVVATYDTDAYGNALASTSDSIPNGGLQYRFVGGLGVRWDVVTGLYYMRARWYDAGLGRFLSRDPKRKFGFYSYAKNNPVRLVDPTGLDAIIILSGWNGSYNVFGHIAIGVTGGGVFSYGTGTAPGSDINAYLQQQLAQRDVQYIIIPTTPGQDAAMINLGLSYGPLPSFATGTTCATRTDLILQAGGIDLSPYLSAIGGTYPADVFNAAVNYAQAPYANGGGNLPVPITIPQGGTPPSVLQFQPTNQIYLDPATTNPSGAA